MKRRKGREVDVQQFDDGPDRGGMVTGWPKGHADSGLEVETRSVRGVGGRFHGTTERGVGGRQQKRRAAVCLSASLWAMISYNCGCSRMTIGSSHST